ncbi:uncharacterized protein LOC132260520 [Phlebotomus argentipes]|uniref:uncharacterized protein LOC132260520 n=1 Tax=Phlebotomus argentipes TaxID=94469 RepID=UPI00289351AE|nr:uncharacterized protein LOC132260520 [Phlebotomus argentipes]
MNVDKKSRKVKKRRGKKKLLKDYFKFPMGVTSGTTQYDFSAQESLCACLVGFCYSFLSPEYTWTPNFINEMLRSIAEHNHEIVADPAGDLSPVKMTFLLEKYALDLFLHEISSGAMNQEKDTLFADLKRCLKSRKSVVIVSGGESIAIWTKEENFGYFTFIPNKKQILLVAALKDLVTSLHFLYPSDTSYRICEMKVTRLLQRSAAEEQPELPGRGFVIVDDDLAILQGNLRLESGQNGDNRGLLVGYATAIFAEKFPLCSWDSDILDRVLIVSENLTRKLLSEDSRKSSYLVFCDALRGQLDVDIVFYAEFLEVLEDVRRIEGILALGRCLVMEYQGNFWTIMQQNLFYFLNPYEHLGNASSLQMHQTLQGVLAILANLAEESTRVTLHIVKVVSVRENEPNSPQDDVQSLKASEIELPDQQLLGQERKKREQESQLAEMVRTLKERRKEIQSKLREVASPDSPDETAVHNGSLRTNSHPTAQAKSGSEDAQSPELQSSDKIQTSVEHERKDETLREPLDLLDLRLSGLEDTHTEEESSEDETEEEEIEQEDKSVLPTNNTYDITKDDSELSEEESASDLIVLQSVSGSAISLDRLLCRGLMMSSRFFITTPVKRFMVIHKNRTLFLYKGCICKISTLPRDISKDDHFWSFRSIPSLIERLLDMNSGGKFM